jgi:hypothetical protein
MANKWLFGSNRKSAPQTNAHNREGAPAYGMKPRRRVRRGGAIAPNCTTAG